MNRRWMQAAGALMVVCLVFGMAVWYFVGTREFMENMGTAASEKISGALGVRADVGTVRVSSLRSVTMENLVLFDARGQEIAKAESAKVGFSFFGVLGSDPVKAIRSVDLEGVQARLEKRSDGTWNYEDLLSEDSEKSTFDGKVRVGRGAILFRMDGNELFAHEVEGTVDFDDSDAPEMEAKGLVNDAEITLKGTFGEEIRMSVGGKNLAVEDWLAWIPREALPESVVLKRGSVESFAFDICRQDGTFSADGKVKVSGGELSVLGTEVKKLDGMAEMRGKTLTVFLAAEAEGQRAAAHGKIFLGGEEPRLALVAESEGFDPSAVMRDIPYQGAVAFSADITGTPSHPSVCGEMSAKEGRAFGYDFRNARASAAYEDGCIAVRSLVADVFGGRAEGAGEFAAEDLSFCTHVKLFDVDADAFGDAAQGFSGKVSADLGLAGVGNDMEKLSVCGSASSKAASYKGVAIPEASASFCLSDRDLVIDFANVQIENGGEIGVEGTVRGMETLDLKYYVNHADLSLVQNFEPAANVSGFADFDGTVRGAMDNPFVNVHFSAVEGKILEQPYRSLHGSASGNLDGVSIDSFSMEKDGKVNWLVKGTVGFTGARRVNLQVDTMGVRMEDIAAFIAPDQPITGNVDNIITIKGTLDDPDIVGYIHFDRGSYNGYLLSGMDGDYTMKNGVVTLQDFHIFSPRIDMDLNGTVVHGSEALDLTVEAHDIDLERFGGDLPYPVSGHGKFSGRITGTISSPDFDGALTAPELVFNEQVISRVHGSVSMRGHRLIFDPIRFEQNGGTYALKASLNLLTERMDGRIDVRGGDINAIMAIANVKNEAVHGHIDGTIDLAGALSNPSARVSVFMKSGDIGGHAVTNAYVSAALSNRVITLNRFEGEQGAGRFAAEGKVNLDGPIDGHFSAQNIDAGMIAAAAGSSMPFKGALSIEAQFGGTIQNPIADASVEIDGGRAGASTFDSMTGLVRLRGPVIKVEQAVVQKTQGGRLYKASAYGTIPLRALASGIGEELSDYDRMNLEVSLDEGDLGLLPVLSDAVDWAVGETTGHLVIGGTLAEPSVTGAVGIKDGAVKLKALELPFTEIHFGMDFAGDTFTITDGRGRLGDGKIALEGTMRLDGHTPAGYNFKLHADKLDVQSEFYRGELSVDGEFGEGVIYGHSLPKLTAHIKTDKCTISVPTIPESESELPHIILDVGLEVGKNTHFYSPSLCDMWLSGNVHYGGTTRYPAPSGSISVRRGTVTYLQTVFKIRQGEAAFNQVSSFLPSVSFHADARLSRTKVFLALDGPLDAMNLKLTSSPEMSRSEILKLLTLRGAYRSGEDTSEEQWAALAGAGLQMSFLGDIEDSLREFLMLDELVISHADFEKSKKEGDNAGFGGYNVTIGKYITDKIMLEYTHGINRNVSRFLVRYDFDDRLSVFAGRREGGNNVFGFEGRFTF